MQTIPPCRFFIGLPSYNCRLWPLMIHDRNPKPSTHSWRVGVVVPYGVAVHSDFFFPRRFQSDGVCTYAGLEENWYEHTVFFAQCTVPGQVPISHMLVPHTRFFTTHRQWISWRRKADTGTRWEGASERRVFVPSTIIVDRPWSRTRWLPYSDTVRVVIKN